MVLPSIRQRSKQKRAFSPECADDVPRNKPFTEPYTKKRMKKNAFRPRRAACAAVFLFVCAPSVGGAPFVGGVMSPGGLSAPVNGAWRSKSLHVCGVGGFSRERRMFHVKHSNKMARRAFAGETTLFCAERHWRRPRRILGGAALEKPPRLRIGRRFLAISARLYVLRAASAAFSLKRGECFT